MLLLPPIPSLLISPSEGFVLLGSPIGSPFSESVILRRVRKVETTLSCLPDLLDSQMETTLLRSCLSLPKVAFALRTCPPEYIANASKVFDSAIRASLSDITGYHCQIGLGRRLLSIVLWEASISVWPPFKHQQLSLVHWLGAKISFPESLDGPQMSPPTCNPPFSLGA